MKARITLALLLMLPAALMAGERNDVASCYQQAKIALIKAKAARLTDTAALFTALGGGWWNRPEDKLAAR